MPPRRVGSRAQPPDPSGFYRTPSADEWFQGDVFRSPAGSLDRRDLIGLDDGGGEGGLFAVMRVVNGTPELGAADGIGLVMIVSHTCDFSEKYRRDGRRGQPLIVAPLVPLAFLGDRNAQIAWEYGWEGALKHVLPLPPAPPHFADRTALLLRFLTAVQPEILGRPLIGLSLRERRRLRQQLARFFSRLDVSTREIGAQEEADYPDPAEMP